MVAIAFVLFLCNHSALAQSSATVNGKSLPVKSTEKMTPEQRQKMLISSPVPPVPQYSMQVTKEAVDSYTSDITLWVKSGSNRLNQLDATSQKLFNDKKFDELYMYQLKKQSTASHEAPVAPQQITVPVENLIPMTNGKNVGATTTIPVEELNNPSKKIEDQTPLNK